MWLDTTTEKNVFNILIVKWAEAFKFSGESKIVLLNPGKRKRFAEHEGALTLESISIDFQYIQGKLWRK